MTVDVINKTKVMLCVCLYDGRVIDSLRHVKICLCVCVRP